MYVYTRVSCSTKVYIYMDHLDVPVCNVTILEMYLRNTFRGCNLRPHRGGASRNLNFFRLLTVKYSTAGLSKIAVEYPQLALFPSQSIDHPFHRVNAPIRYVQKTLARPSPSPASTSNPPRKVSYPFYSITCRRRREVVVVEPWRRQHAKIIKKMPNIMFLKRTKYSLNII